MKDRANTCKKRRFDLPVRSISVAAKRAKVKQNLDNWQMHQ
jgi:hypothetical protein